MNNEPHQWHSNCLKSLLVLNLFDAICTYFWVACGLAEEANPIMAYILTVSPPGFILYKILIVNLSVLLLWRLRSRLFCRIVTIPVTAVYVGIAMIHVSFIMKLLYFTV
jgi:hypothetical protein